MTSTRKIIYNEISYEILQLLGQGAFGNVYKAIRTLIPTNDKKEVALKAICIISEKDKLDVFKEIKITEKLSKSPKCSPYITCIYESFLFNENIKDYVIIVMELATQGNLNNYINNNAIVGVRGEFKGKTKEFLTRIFMHLLKGMKTMHNEKIFHLDIKPENILLFEKEGKLIPKYADFGLSCIFQNINGISECNGGGTVAYMSPEYFMTYIASKKPPFDILSLQDLYSLGIVFWMLANLNLSYIKINEYIIKYKIDNKIIQKGINPASFFFIIAIPILEQKHNAERYPDSSINNLIKNMVNPSIKGYNSEKYKELYTILYNNIIQKGDKQEIKNLNWFKNNIRKIDDWDWYPGMSPFRYTLNQAIEYLRQENDNCTIDNENIDTEKLKLYIKSNGIPISPNIGLMELCLIVNNHMNCKISSGNTLNEKEIKKLANILGIFQEGEDMCHIILKELNNKQTEIKNRVTKYITKTANLASKEKNVEEREKNLKVLKKYKNLDIISNKLIISQIRKSIKLSKRKNVNSKIRERIIKYAKWLSNLLDDWNISVPEELKPRNIRIIESKLKIELL